MEAESDAIRISRIGASTPRSPLLHSLKLSGKSDLLTPPISVSLLVCLALASSNCLAETLVPIKRHQSLNTYYISVGVAGTAAEDYLLDTGAGYMTITDQTLLRVQAAGDATFVRQLDGQLADGSVLRVPVYRLREIQLARSCVLHDIEVAVLPGASRGLFGLSALKRVSPFELSFDPPTLRLTNCNAALEGGESAASVSDPAPVAIEQTAAP